MKKFMALLCTVLTVLCVSFAVVGCDVTDSDPNSDSGTIGTTSSKKLSVSNEDIAIDFTQYLGYSVKVTGTITNTTGKDLSYISVQYKIYDSSNAVIGTAFANANNIGAGETWKFEASSMGWFDDEPATVKFDEIQTMRAF